MDRIRGSSLERALPAIVGFITDKMGVRVLRGDRAMTDGAAVYVPKVPELLLGVRDVVRFIAYIYHESFHIRETNFTLAEGALPPLHQACVRVLEDIRIEAAGMVRFPSAKKYLSQLVRIFTEDGMAGISPGFPPFGEDTQEAKLLQFYMLYKLRHDVLGQVDIQPSLEITEKSARAKFPRTMMIRLDALMFQVTKCDSTDDVFALGAEIAAMIKEEHEKEEERRRQEQQASNGAQAPDQAQPASNGAQAPGSEEQEESAKSDSSTDDAGDSASVPGSGGSSEADDAEGDPPGNDGGDAGGQGAGGSGDLEKLITMAEEDISETIDEMLEAVLNETAEALAGQGTTVPNQHKLRLPKQATDLASLRGAVNAVRTRTLQWMASQSESDVTHSRAGVHLDYSRLHAARGNGEIFIRSEEGIDLNAAVSFVVDRSGSMSDCIADAVRATVASMLAFDVPGIKTRVTVFPVYAPVGATPQDEGVAVIKDWEEKPNDLAARIAGLTTDGGTPMAEAVLFGTTDLLRRDETLKLLVVVTDGVPNGGPARTREVIDVARSAGVTVVGLGIGVDPSAVFGTRYSVALESVNELAGAMVKLIKTSMYH